MLNSLTEETVREFSEQIGSLSLWSGACTNCGSKYILGININKICMPSSKCCDLMSASNFQLDNSEKVCDLSEGSFTIGELFEKKLLSIMSSEQQKLYLDEFKE